MKRNTLTTAVLAGLTGVAGMASVANAVNVNPGLGQVLLFPYYTARGGNDTMISIVNTSEDGKAVKVRFLEPLNSREVLDFNLYMSEYDVWTAGITATATGAKMITWDTTCTSPYFIGQAGGPGNMAEEDFLDFAFADPLTADGGPTSLDRTRSGYIEVIEMGTLGMDAVNSEDVEAAARHVRSGSGRGAPGPSGSEGSNANTTCGLFQERWVENSFLNGNGIWLNDSSAGLDPVSGGLFGNGTIINTDDGTMFTYEAVALDNFWPASTVNHFEPGDTNPNLAQGQSQSNVFLSNTTTVESRIWSDPIDAVNHVLAQESLMNEYNVTPSLGANSEWIVTFPTKRQHTDAAPGGFTLGTARAPFTQLWTESSPVSCETISLDVWDREEQSLTFGTDGDVCPSPRPKDPVTGEDIPCSDDISFALCRESNVVRWGLEDESLPAMAEITGEPSPDEAERPQYGYVNIAVPGPAGHWDYSQGWASFDFSGFSGEASQSDDTFVGLPAIGFWANTYTNNDVAGGVLANYGGSFNHRGSRSPVVSVD